MLYGRGQPACEGFASASTTPISMCRRGWPRPLESPEMATAAPGTRSACETWVERVRGRRAAPRRDPADHAVQFSQNVGFVGQRKNALRERVIVRLQVEIVSVCRVRSGTKLCDRASLSERGDLVAQQEWGSVSPASRQIALEEPDSRIITALGYAFEGVERCRQHRMGSPIILRFSAGTPHVGRRGGVRRAAARNANRWWLPCGGGGRPRTER